MYKYLLWLNPAICWRHGRKIHQRWELPCDILVIANEAETFFLDLEKSFFSKSIFRSLKGKQFKALIVLSIETLDIFQ